MAKTVAGRPVVGEIETRREARAEQKAIEEFVADLDEVFAFTDVEAIRWQQYTPYFNDGDPCVFGVHDFYVKLTGGDPEGGDYEDGFLGSYCVNRYYGVDYDYRERNHHPIAALLDERLDYRAVKAYEDVLEDAFGDPAEVTATREGFSVEYYEHD